MSATALHRASYFEYRPYPFVTPPELSGGAPRHDVAIVGAGPVGLAVALDLAVRGVRSVVVTDGDTESPGSRAACISRRSMEILQQIGCIDAFEAVALPWTSGTSFFRGRPIYRLEMPHSRDERYFPMANLQQNLLERIMLQRAAATGLVEMRWRSRVTGLRQDGTGVVLQVQTPAGGYDLQAAYAVAADGARSTMRKLLDLGLSGTSYSGRYLIADIHMQSRSPTERRAWFDSEANRGSTVLMHRQPHDIWRVDYQLRDGDDSDAEMQEPRLRRRIQEVLDMAGETAPWELDWVSLYSAHCLCLESYLHDRVVFVGDAAHLVPIFGVRGLNSGLADANNLGWKLAAVLDGSAPATLLQSYSAERRAATLDIFQEAGKSTRFMTPPTRGYRLLRRAALSLSLSEGWAGALANPRQSTAFTYAESPLNVWPEGEADFRAGPAAGSPLCSVRLDEGFLHDRLGTRALLLYFAGDGDEREMLADLTAVADAKTADLLVVDGEGAAGLADPDGRIAAAYDAAPGTLYLVRPDWHVAGRTRRRPDRASIAAAMDRIRGTHA
ncbi:FAD-dependent monooxygenase [Marinibaculum pumilum]|uniref:FAD-dependent monooxygenase n=1 Tax=Marinibaculum pumilum TaxID=1766165 RepID=A0ABV7L1N9_9PROT